MKGIDAAFNLSPHIQAIKDAGIGFVCRYYSWNVGKDLSPAEARALSDRGLQIVAVWEARGDSPASFNAPQGQRDAQAALALAISCGQPEGSAIYFAVDFDAAEIIIETQIIPYFQAINGVLHGKYAVGVYGSGLVLGKLFRLGLVSHLWLAQARWQGSHGFTGAHIEQGSEDETILPYPVDTDTSATDDFGSWLVGGAARPIVIGELPKAALPSDADIIANIASVQKQLQARGYYKGKIDGIFGPLTNAALVSWEQAG